MLDYIPKSRVNNLHLYKYQRHRQVSSLQIHPRSILDLAVELFPKSVAPNTITLSGLLLVFINFATLAYVDPASSARHSSSFLPPLTRSRSTRRSPRTHRCFPCIRSLPTLASPVLPPRSISPSFDTAGRCLPPWVFYTWALCLFAYQSLDAIDGKQARRTGWQDL